MTGNAALDLAGLFGLDGRVALVTGGGSGLGAAAARALATAGALVTIAGRRTEVLDEAQAKLAAAGLTVTAMPLDVTDAALVDRSLGRLAVGHGRVDVLVNMAGVAHQATPEQTTPDDWERVLAVNLTGTFNCARAFAALPHPGAGRAIVNVASLTSAVGVRGQSAYAASKGGVTALTRALALDFAPQGIRVNALAPGYFRTDMPREVLADPVATGKLLRRIPLRRVGEPDEIGGAVAFLAGPAASYMTGSTLYLDGGYTAQ